jgi:hypothetical protein
MMGIQEKREMKNGLGLGISLHIMQTDMQIGKHF